MKHVEDMNRDELCALTDEQIERIIDLECARAGVPLRPTAPDAPHYPETPDPDLPYWTVEGVELLDVTEALRLAEFINALESRVTVLTWHRPPKVEPVDSAIAPRRTVILSAEAHARHARAIESRAAMEAEYKDALKAYEAANEERSEVAESICQRISLASAEAREICHLVDLYGRYLDLADGSHEVAERFLREGYRGENEALIAEALSRCVHGEVIA